MRTIKYETNYKDGYIALMTVLILGAIAVTIGTSLILLGLGSSRSSLTNVQAAQASTLADACVEDALREIRSSVVYSGSKNIVFATGSCSSNVTVLTGQNRTITSSGIVGNITKSISVNIDSITPKINVSQWQETP